MADLIRNLSSILKNGGQRAGYRRVTVDSSDVITAAETNWHNFNYRTASKISNKMNAEKIYGEDGEYLVTEKGNQDFSYVLTSAQLDKATLDFLIAYGSQSIFFQFIVMWGKGADQKTLEAFFPLVQFSGDWDISFPGRKFDITLDILNNVNSHTPSNFTGLSWVKASTSDLICAAGNKIAVAETT